MRPAERESDVAPFSQRAIAGIAVDLENALEAGEVRDRLLGLAVRRVDIGDRRRVRSAPGPVVSRVGPKLAGLGPPAPRIEHRRRRLVGEQLRRRPQMRENALVHGPQVERGASDPVGERRAIETNALPLVNLGLAIERQVVGVFGDDHVRDRRLGRQAALDQPRRRRRLDDDVLASAAGIFGSAHDQHSELRRHDVEPLADVLADLVKLAPAARAGLVLNVDDRLDARQMRRQRSAVRAPLARRRRPLRRRSLPRPPPPRPPRSARGLRARAAIDPPATSRRDGRSDGAAIP